jgi:hypothetical protein
MKYDSSAHLFLFLLKICSLLLAFQVLNWRVHLINFY